MADHIRHFAVTEAPGSDASNFSSYAVTINQGVVTAVVLHLPDGHAGLTGIRLDYGNHQIIPDPPDDFYTGNRRSVRKELSELYPTGGTWFVEVYNEGRHDHTFSVDFEIDALDLLGLDLPPVILLPFIGEGGSVSPDLPVPGLPGVGPAVPV